MPLDVSEVAGSPDAGISDIVVTKPPEQSWTKRRPRRDVHPIVVVPSDSEDDSDDDDIAIVSVCPPPPSSDNDDCIVESYQPASDAFCAVADNRILPVRSPVDISCGDGALDLQFTSYGRNADQTTGTFLVHDVPNIGAWILSGDASSAAKPPERNSPPIASVENSLGNSPVPDAAFGLPLSIPSADARRPQPAYSGDSVPFGTVKLQTSGIVFDVGTAEVSANIDETSVLSLSAKIQSSDDRRGTTVSFVGSISDGKSPTSSGFVSMGTTAGQSSDDLSVSLVATGSPNVGFSDSMNDYRQTASVSLNVNTRVDNLNDTVDGLLRQMSCQQTKTLKPTVVSNSANIKPDRQASDVNVAFSHGCGTAADLQLSSHLQSCYHVPSSTESCAILKKRKIRPGMPDFHAKVPRLPLPMAHSAAASTTSASILERPALQRCCCCDNVDFVERLSHCHAGHPCCGNCLRRHFKSMLTSSIRVRKYVVIITRTRID